MAKDEGKGKKRGVNRSAIDSRCAKFIEKVLKRERAVFLSWGVSAHRTIPMGLAIRVNGYKMKGQVHISFDTRSEHFNISFHPDGGKMEKVQGIPYERIVETIDNRIEYTGDDYGDIVDDTYGKEYADYIRSHDIELEDGTII